MNKFDKLELSAILLDLEALRTGNPALAIASTTQEVKKGEAEDGKLDTKDLAKLNLDQAYGTNPQGLMQKIQNNTALYYENLAKEFMNRNNAQGLIALQSILTNNPDFNAFEQHLRSLMKNVSKHKDGGEIEDKDDVVLVNIADKKYRLIVAESEEEKEQGLMEVEELDSDEGMLFDYRNDIQEEISFWMKDTYIPLDIIFVGEDNIVISVKQGQPESEELISENNVAYVIEVNQNSGIVSGDKVSFGNEESEDVSEEVPEGALEILGSDGQVQATLQGSERIFSIKNTKTLVSMAKRAYESQSDSDYKALGRKIFEYMKIQDERDPEYVES